MRQAEAKWEGDLKSGKGTVKLGSGSYEGPYTFVSRFESGPGTNPEELVAAAHAGCFSMAFSNRLAAAGFVAKRVHTVAKVYLEKGDAGFGIPKIELICEGDVPNIDEAKFQAEAEEAKKGCPISKLLAAAEITLSAKLVGR